MKASMFGRYANLIRGLQHSADPQEIDDLEEFLKQCLPNIDDKV